MADRYATVDELKSLIRKLDLHPDDAARKAGVSRETWRGWIGGDVQIPWTAYAFFGLMLAARQQSNVQVYWSTPPLCPTENDIGKTTR
jgi:hypothetical protein